jgi:hypothetical protein
MAKVIHIAGFTVRIGPHLRQRCSWCGAVLTDYDLRNVAVAPKEDGSPGDPPGTWETGSLVAFDGCCSYIVRHTDGDPIPSGFCGDGLAPPRAPVSVPS